MDAEGNIAVTEKDEGRFLSGRSGDHWMTTFQCDLCHFRNMQGRDPFGERDSLLMATIRRANLDAMWSRESSTVMGNAREVRMLMKNARLLGIEDSLLPSMGPFPLEDEQGMGVAVCILIRSLDEGQNDDTVQFETARKMRAGYSNVWHASTERQVSSTMVRQTTKLVATTSPTNAEWFERFMKGMHKRMGDNPKPDLAISIEVMLALMNRFERAWLRVEGDEVAEGRVLFPALFSIVCYCAALRGEEAPLMDLAGTKKHLEEGLVHRYPHVVAALLGRFKGEMGEFYHMMPLAETSASGLKPAPWFRRMVVWYERKAIHHGPVFRDSAGRRARAGEYEYEIRSQLEAIQQEGDGLINPAVQVFEDYGVSRSFRRGSDTQAIVQNVDARDIDLNNRWRRVEKAEGRKVGLKMQQHYADVKQMLKPLLRYSAAL